MELISPELALVDPALRGEVRAALPGPSDCLAPRVRRAPRRLLVATDLPGARTPVPPVRAAGHAPTARRPYPLAPRTPATLAPPAPVFGDMPGRHVARRAAQAVAAGILVSAPFLGPVVLDLLGRA